MTPVLPQIEFHVAAAPSEAYFLRVHLLAASIRRTARVAQDSRIVVTLGRDCDPYDVAEQLPWSAQLGVEWRWVAAETWQRSGIYGMAVERLAHDFQAPFVVILDADTICTGSFTELPELVGDALAGVVAHVSPAAFHTEFLDGISRSGGEYWNGIYAGAGLPPPRLASAHTGWGLIDGDPQRRRCPPYFNLGMLAAPAERMRELGAVVLDELANVEATIDIFFRCQLAVMLAAARTGTPTVDLPTAWNFPNDPRFWNRWRRDARDIRLLHYLSRNEFDRDRDTGSLAGLEAFLTRHAAEPVNRVLRDAMLELHAATNGHLGAHEVRVA